MNKAEVKQYVDTVREKKPLIHNITNVVVTNFTANGLLAFGASPVMSYAKEEAADMARIANALVLNIGTLTADTVEAMHEAGHAAGEKGIPIVLDPVGAGATPYRTDTVKGLLQELPVTLLRGNASEIANVAGLDWEVKGVDAGEVEGNVEEVAVKAANQLGVTVAVTGKTDIVTDGSEVLAIDNGHPLLTAVTGAGCLLSSFAASFLAVDKEHPVMATAAALGSYGVAGEIAADKKGKEGPGSFQMEFLNALYQLGTKDLEERLLVQKKA